MAISIDLFLDAGVDNTITYPIAQILDEIAQQGLTPAEVERLIRKGRMQYMDISDWKGAITRHTHTCLYSGLDITYFLIVPQSYTPQTPNPLTFVLHGGNNAMSNEEAENTALTYIDLYATLALEGDHILVAPATTKGWGPTGVANIFSILSELTRVFYIDTERIHATGQSMGGHLSYRLAIWYADRFGGVSPHSGGYDFVKLELIENLLNTAGYVVFGEFEPYGIHADNKKNEHWLRENKGKWTFREKIGGGHDIYEDEMRPMLHFFRQNPRNMYPKEVRMRIRGSLRYEGESHERWSHPIPPIGEKTFRANSRTWLRLNKSPNSDAFMTIRGKIEGNLISLQTENVTELEVWLHPNMIDWNKEVTIKVNDAILFHALPTASIEDMLHLVREYDDRGRIFWQRIVLCPPIHSS